MGEATNRKGGGKSMSTTVKCQYSATYILLVYTHVHVYMYTLYLYYSCYFNLANLASDATSLIISYRKYYYKNTCIIYIVFSK